MKSKTNKNSSIFILVIIIATQLIYTTGAFVYKFIYKHQQLYPDEICSYGSANSYYKPNFHIKKNGNVYRYESEDFDNLNEWIPGKKLHDYITVQKGERFAYDSVYSNLKTDLHPPLYYMAVHTICSLFPDKFSFWYAYILNVFALIFTQIYLYKLVMLISKDHSPTIALLSCLLYGGGVGALETFIFLRMYAWAAALVTAHIYYQFRLFLSEDFNIKKNIFPIALTGLLGLLTHNLYAVIMGICTACICLWLLCKKKIKKMFVYGFSMVATLCIFFLIFPSALNQILGRFGIIQNTGEEPIYLPFSKQIELYLNAILRNTLGIKINFNAFLRNLVLLLMITGILIALALPIIFLLRETDFIKHTLSKIEAFFNHKSKKNKEKIRLKLKIEKNNFPIIILITIILLFAFVLSKSIDASYANIYISRYVMPIFPITCAFAIIVIKYITQKIKKIKLHSQYACIFITVIILLAENIAVENPYFRNQPKDYVNIQELAKNTKCEAIINSPGTMTNYLPILMNCYKVKFSLPEQFYNFRNDTINIDGISENETMYLILGKVTNLKPLTSEARKLTAQGYKIELSEEKVLIALKKNPKVNSVKLLGHINIMFDTASVIKIN